MARYASQAKGGYFPTPPAEMALALKRLQVEDGSTVNLLDPCAGEGLALKQMADHVRQLGARPVTYGNELEDTRADKAKKHLDHVLKGGYEVMRMTNKSVSCMYLNPPYDWRNGVRLEKIFLRDLTAPDKYLQDGGLLIFCIPQETLKDCANLLATRFEQLQVYRFTDENYLAYRQVMVFGYRRTGRGGPETIEARKKLEDLAVGGPGALPVLDEPDGIKYLVPPAAKEVTLFRGSYHDPKEIALDVDNSPAWETFEDLLMPPTARRDCRLEAPFILPPKEMMIAVAIVSGAAGGNMGGDHLLVGMTKKVQDRSVEELENGHKEISIERHVTISRVFSPKGVFTLE
jgi:hypothetical protein